MLIYILGLVGVAGFAMSGALAAGEKKLDWVGVEALAVVTAIGGGTVRDLLLNRDVVFWIDDPMYLLVAILSGAFTILYTHFFRPPTNALLIADALGLAMFTIVGAQIAAIQQVPALIVITMGVLTGVAGGVLRDVLSNKTPLLFRSTESLYSVTALGGVVAYVLLQEIHTSQNFSVMVGMLTIVILRCSAIYWEIKLPAFHVSSSKK